jgi:2-oxo-3-hexenedioate decarboxylase
VTDANRAALSERLASFTLTLRRGGALVETGLGANVLGHPALALVHLAELVAGQPAFDAPGAGEIITTGTITDAQPIAPREQWSSDYGTLGVDGLEASFT